MLDKQIYDMYKSLIQEARFDSLEEKLGENNEQLIAEYVQDYLENNGKNIEKDFMVMAHFKQLLLPIIASSILPFNIGFFAAILAVFELLVDKSKKSQSFIKEIKAICQKSNKKNILMYLYYHPDSQHKTISAATGLKANYLSQLMRELEKADCVVRYGIGKRSFYSLTADAKEFICNQERERQEQIIENSFDYLEKYNPKPLDLSKSRKYEMDIEKYDTSFWGYFKEQVVPLENNTLQVSEEGII